MTVLVLRALGLGDFLTALPALRAIRRNFAGWHVALAAPPALAPLVQLSGVVDDLVAAEPLAAVGVKHPEVAVNLHGRGPQSHRVLLATRPGDLIAFSNPDVPESSGMPKWTRDEHEVDRWCRLLRESGIYATPNELSLRAPEVAAPAQAVGATIIHPGAAAAARRWPLARWAEVASAEARLGHRVAVTAGPDELPLAASLVAMAGLYEGSIVTGDLLDLAAAVAVAKVVVCADTGVAHLATALGTPSIVLFGPTSPALWGPPSWHPHVALWAGRRGDPHGGTPDGGLLEITSGSVVAALESLGRRSLN